MPSFIVPILFFLLGAIWWFLYLRRTAQPSPNHLHQKLPPGPRGLPIIGNLHMLGNLPHRSLYKIAKKYGPLMSLRLGNVPTIILSSPQTAELFLKTHDTIFASRGKAQSSEFLSYGTKGIAFTEYGPYWRNVRKFCTIELLSATKIDSMAGMRREELGLLVRSLKEAAAARVVVDLSDMVEGLIADMTCRMLFGRSRDDRFDLKGTIQGLTDVVGAFNFADYIPFLEPLDIQGLTRRFKTKSRAIDKILEIVIDDHEKNAMSRNKEGCKDFVDVMLSFGNKPASIASDEQTFTFYRANIKAILLDIIFGAIDTSHTAIEWTMSELIRHPEVMKRLQDEIKTYIGENKIVEENQLPKLKYLEMVVKESLRLHPVAPLLVPHESMEDTVINGYYIPKKSRIIVNSWALGHDPDVWSENVEEFLPERFINSNIDLRGRDFQLIPFGSGRRGCPGMHLGLVNINLVVAQLVYCFDWELPDGLPISELEMDEKFGLSLHRANHIHAIPNLRL